MGKGLARNKKKELATIAASQRAFRLEIRE
jgi:hypothetical protein